MVGATPTGAPKLIVNGKRVDGRSSNDLRQIKMEVGVLKKADGSAYIEWGKNKVMVGIYGPKECIPRHQADPFKAVIHADYDMAAFSGMEERSRPGPNRRAREISKVLRHALENVILLEQFPKTAIDVRIEILQSSGGTRCAALTAASLALADAGIPMKDLITAVAVGKAAGQMVVDLSQEEDNFGEADIPMAFSMRTREILLLQQDGVLSKEEINEAIKLGLDAASKIRKMQVDALKKKYNAK